MKTGTLILICVASILVTLYIVFIYHLIHSGDDRRKKYPILVNSQRNTWRTNKIDSFVDHKVYFIDSDGSKVILDGEYSITTTIK